METEEGEMGRIEVIYGPMFSGKTSTLIQRILDAQQNTESWKIYKPIIDQRYSANEVVTHDQKSLPCQPVSGAREIIDGRESYQWIAIDEAQFFDGNILEVCQTLRDRGSNIVIAGLAKDYQKQDFGFMPSLIAIADQITQIFAKCNICGEKALHTKRISDKNTLIEIGSSESYQAVCDHHY